MDAWTSQLSAGLVATIAFLLVFGAAAMVLTIALVKGAFANVVAFFQIKFNSDYQYNSSIQIGERRNCYLKGCHLMSTEVWDLDTGQVLTIRNEEFVKNVVWVNRPKSGK